jgi:glycerate-2-kinase
MAREIALKLLKVGVEAADPKNCIRRHVKIRGGRLLVGSKAFQLNDFKRIFVVGGGKASGGMAEAIEEIFGSHIYGGIVNVPRKSAGKYRVKRIKLNEAGHPVPDEDGVRGALEILKLAEEAEEDDLVFALISGGGSALMPLPVEGLTLNDKQETTKILLGCGASIGEVNTVRKHISAIKGGRLALKAYPATLIALILSDVVGDKLESIASGPTAPDPTTYREALEICRTYNVLRKIPERVRRILEKGAEGVLEETLKPDNPVLAKVVNILVGTNRESCEAMFNEAGRMGLNRLILTTTMEGEARHVGLLLASILAETATSGIPIRKPAVLIVGGETTVTVRGSGKGGRNQELALSASRKLEGLDGVALASMDSDGIDGYTDAAGAVADGYTVKRSRRLKIDLESTLNANNSYSFFLKLGDLIFTGLTGTNVNDFVLLIAV